MATLVLGAVGSAIGGAFGGAILGFSGAAIGGFIGSTIGSVVDSWIVSSLAPTQRIEGPRLDSLRITSSTEGAVIPRVYGRMRMGGNIIWATDFREETKTSTQGGGKGGGGGKVKTTEYLYYASFAVALCEGPITGIGRIWADGKPMDTCGAGDCFRGSYVGARYGEGRGVLDAMTWAAAAGSLSVEVEGAMPSMPSRQQIAKRANEPMMPLPEL